MANQGVQRAINFLAQARADQGSMIGGQVCNAMMFLMNNNSDPQARAFLNSVFDAFKNASITASSGLDSNFNQARPVQQQAVRSADVSNQSSVSIERQDLRTNVTVSPFVESVMSRAYDLV